MLTQKQCVCGRTLEFDESEISNARCRECGTMAYELNDAGAAPAQPPPPKAKGFYILVDDETKGPYSLKQITGMYESGQLTMDTLCASDGDPNWKTVHDVVERATAALGGRSPNSQAPLHAGPTIVQMARQPKSRTVYILLAIFLGMFGLHNFYAAKPGSGVIQLALTVLLGWILIGLLINLFWIVAEVFSVDTDGTGMKMEW